MPELNYISGDMTEYNYERNYESFLSVDNIFISSMASLFIGFLCSIAFVIFIPIFSNSLFMCTVLWVLFILLLGICIFLSDVYSELKKNEDKVHFTYREFKDWLIVSPQRITVNKKGYFIRFSSNQGSIELYPKTMKDLFQFAWYCQRKYDKLKKVEQNKKEQKKKVELNNDKIKVLTTLQIDIERILEESKEIIKSEVKNI